MKSMTGYGRGESSRDGYKVTVEISSVNRKQSEVVVNLPRELEVLEAQARDVVNRSISRGKVTTRIALHAAEGGASVKIKLNRNLAKAYARELNALARELKLAAGVSMEVLARIPGIIESGLDATDAEDFWPATEKALNDALTTMVKMRAREGQHLAKDLTARISTMRKAVARVQKQAPEVQKRYREQLIERITAAGLNTPEPDDERLLKEIVYFADRSDINEELTRLQSHFQQFEDCQKSSDPVGRTLDFLAQEMNREINTIGSKANDATISREVVILKTELEKFREQAMNVE
jgi:uncharacterized protein (TIGR00255 family)